MKVAIMQPYFLPYLGYLQLIKSVDRFVIYDTIKYTKKGWINRNRYLTNNEPTIFSIPIKKDSDYLNINQRILSDNYLDYNKKTLRKIEQSYKKAPNFNEIFPMISDIFLFDKTNNLFDFIFNSIEVLVNYLEIKTPLIKSSEIDGDDTILKAKVRVVNICNQLSADEYINPIGGTDLYSKEVFQKYGLNLNFHKINEIEYQQFSNPYVPYLSILDTMMFTDAHSLLNEYKLV
tara:strand:- start:1622 stop:2320 length:699 start_codon:yes stop_codon:yes gene_type:complete